MDVGALKSETLNHRLFTAIWQPNRKNDPNNRENNSRQQGPAPVQTDRERSKFAGTRIGRSGRHGLSLPPPIARLNPSYISPQSRFQMGRRISHKSGRPRHDGCIVEHACDAAQRGSQSEERYRDDRENTNLRLGHGHPTLFCNVKP